MKIKKNPITFHTAHVSGVKIFYRKAGDPAAPMVLLLHGFPTSSHMFRNLIPELAGDFHVIAPDLPGFGLSGTPNHRGFQNTFDYLGKIIGDFVEQIGRKKFTIYIFDYGAPTGLRVALRFPDRISALITQNGNAYIEGFSDAWEPWKNYWKNPTAKNREACRDALSFKVIRNIQYFHGTDPKYVSPDGYMLDVAYLARPGADEMQLDLILDYRSNVALYPKFQEFFREFQPPTLAVWGKNDPFFLPAGARAYQRDNPKTKIIFYDTGHFALETHAVEIGREIRVFLKKHTCRGQKQKSRRTMTHTGA
jgi:pimeloyl-ACP methyl ester carboxylesterase